jgi:hypothetical protein
VHKDSEELGKRKEERGFICYSASFFVEKEIIPHSFFLFSFSHAFIFLFFSIPLQQKAKSM